MNIELGRRLKQSYLYGAVAVVLVAWNGAAFAFSLFSPLVEEGEVSAEMRYANVVAGEDTEKGNQMFAAAVEWSFIDAWRAEFSAEYFKAKGLGTALEGYELEFVRALAVQGNDHAVSSAVVFGGAFPKEETLAKRAEVGVYLEKGFGNKASGEDQEDARYDSSLLLNLYLNRQYGNNAEAGLSFEYAAQYKWNVSDLAFGVEMYGEMGKLDSMPAFSEQEHYLGPVLYGELKMGKDMGLGYDIGYLVGATAAAADGVLKLNVEMAF